MMGEKNHNWNYNKKIIIRRSRKEMGDFMKKNNPMKNLENVKKMKQTLKLNVKAGKTKYKHGKEHPLWKGNRTYKLTIRSKLSKWRKRILKQDNFICQKCNIRGGHLEIHHTFPLRKIEKMFSELYNFNFLDVNIKSDGFEFICQNIIDYHFMNTKLGITVCSKCHGEIDPMRHTKKN